MNRTTLGVAEKELLFKALEFYQEELGETGEYESDEQPDIIDNLVNKLREEGWK